MSQEGPSWFRRAISSFLLTSGLLFVLLGVVLIYATYIFFDQRSFANRAVISIQNPSVAIFLADRISQAAIQSNRDLTPYRPLIFYGAREVVASGAFTPLVRSSAEMLHFVAFSEGGRNLILNITDAGTLLKSTLPALPPKISEKIPADLVVGIAGNIQESALISKALPPMKKAASFSWYSRPILLLGALLLLLAAALSPTPRKVGREVGWLAILIALLIAALRVAGPIAARTLIRDTDIANAVSGVWASFLFDAMSWSLVLSASGFVLLAASGAPAFGKIDLREFAHTVWRWMAVPPEGLFGRWIRASVLVAIGVVLLEWPQAIVQTATVLAGFFGLYLGMSAFGDLVFRFGHRAQLPVPRSGLSAIEAVRPAGLVLALALALSGGVLWLYLRFRTGELGIQPSHACNGMKELCNQPLNQVVFPTAHNAMASADQPVWFFPAQDAGIGSQLKDGIRGFQIDAYYGHAVGNRVLTVIEDMSQARRKYEKVIGKEGVDAAFRIRERLIGGPLGEKGIYLCHGFCELGALDLIATFKLMRGFLQKNPNEVLMIVIQDEDVLPEDIARAVEDSGLSEYIYHGPLKAPWPTLEEMIQSKQQVVMFGENRTGNIPWYHQAFEVFQETPYDFRSVESFSCKPWRGETQGSLFQLNHWITRFPAPKPRDAELVNSYDFLINRVRRCARERHKLPNLLAVDFYRTGDLFKVAEELNRLGSVDAIEHAGN